MSQFNAGIHIARNALLTECHKHSVSSWPTWSGLKRKLSFGYMYFTDHFTR